MSKKSELIDFIVKGHIYQNKTTRLLLILGLLFPFLIMATNYREFKLMDAVIVLPVAYTCVYICARTIRPSIKSAKEVYEVLLDYVENTEEEALEKVWISEYNIGLIKAIKKGDKGYYLLPTDEGYMEITNPHKIFTKETEAIKNLYIRKNK